MAGLRRWVKPRDESRGLVAPSLTKPKSDSSNQAISSIAFRKNCVRASRRLRQLRGKPGHFAGNAGTQQGSG
jgi:hypothetical protein